MADWDDERGRRTSVLGRVDWACWLAAVGLLFLTVIAFLVQFAALGIVAIVIAVLLVVFDSWVNRPGGIRGRGAAADDGRSDVRSSTPMPPRRQAERPRQRAQQPQPNRPAPNYQANRQGQPAQQRRAQQPRTNGRPVRQPQPQRQNGQPGRPQPGQQPTRAANPQQPYRQSPPQPTAGRDQGYRART